MTNKMNMMWRLALKKGTTELSDVFAGELPFGNLPLLMQILQVKVLKSAPIETPFGNYLLMFDGEEARPFSQIMVWRYRLEGNRKIIEDMRMEDAWILENIWRYWLMPEDTDAEFVPPKGIITME